MERKKLKRPISQTGTTNKHMNKKKRSNEEVLFLKEKNMRDEILVEQDALKAAF